MPELAIQRCVYCQANTADTVDHVPPKLLFNKADRNLNLITVPSCQKCNKSFELDDNNFSLLSADERNGNNITAAAVREKVLRGIMRPAALGFRSYIHDRSTYEFAQSESGIYFRRADEVQLDSSRLRSTLKRCVRGLTFIERDFPLSLEASIEVYSPSELESFTPEQYAELETSSITQVQQNTIRQVGDVFEYSAHFPDGYPSVWRLKFWEWFEIYAMVKAG